MKKPLWEPLDIESTNLSCFIREINRKYALSINNYSDLYKWSIDNKKIFWQEIWHLMAVINSSYYEEIYREDTNRTKIPRPVWFPGAKLNFAENLLKYKDNSNAIISLDENGNRKEISFNELYELVAKVANGLKELGLKKGDRIAAIVPNVPEAIIYMLAATSMGAIWSSGSPEFGVQGILDRFGQIRPTFLLSVDGYYYNGKEFDISEKINEVSNKIESIEKVIVINKIGSQIEKFNNSVSAKTLENNDADSIEFVQLPFDYPVYIMYSSGTTGVPKCIVHGAGGTLLQHFKEHYLHCNLNKNDILSYFTTCGWMMWNWLVGGLTVGATLFLYDGSPSHPFNDNLWKAAEENKINIFGTSPKFLSFCQKTNQVPKDKFNLDNLKVILSTGSPLTKDNFEWVYNNVKKDVQLSSISGGTDIISCFVLGNPNLPVYSEEIQCRGLGMEVYAYNQDSEAVLNQKGELVCRPPFPSMPIHFWDDPDDEKYHSAYFSEIDSIWKHGDFIEINDREGIIVHGRSDATLNPGGIRIGTAEIYRIVEAMEEIKDSIVVGQKYNDDIRVVLFVVTKDGYNFGNQLVQKIIENIKDSASPRHVPAIIKEISEVPVTLSGKKVEIAVTNILNNEKINNKSALANPDSLNQFYGILDERS